MNWLVEILQGFFSWTFETILVPFGWAPNWIFILLISFGLAYWTFFWQPWYNKKAKGDAKQIK